MSHFDFISNQTLRNNLDIAFDHVLTLIPFSESKSYRKLAKSSFRKTIIIYTASIIEALLFNQVHEKCSENDLTLYKWELENPKELHEIDDKHKIIGGDYVFKPTVLKLDKINLGIINKLLLEKKLINEDLFEKIDKVRILRNDQHFGTHQVIKEYTKTDLEFVFSVAKDVKKLVQS
ncbi:MAG: hypothetical protein Q7K54_02260 [Candidatus Parcubacteria bacterium]|nr:hypothetical protein [Candidatus Parcubacteria bacterium]